MENSLWSVGCGIARHRFPWEFPLDLKHIFANYYLSPFSLTLCLYIQWQIRCFMVRFRAWLRIWHFWRHNVAFSRTDPQSTPKLATISRLWCHEVVFQHPLSLVATYGTACVSGRGQIWVGELLSKQNASPHLLSLCLQGSSTHLWVVDARASKLQVKYIWLDLEVFDLRRELVP